MIALDFLYYVLLCYYGLNHLHCVCIESLEEKEI